MKRIRDFKEGDKVFAKIKGYPNWPAEIIDKSGKKFRVQFYGTREIGYIKPEDLHYYLKSKERYKMSSKKKEFKLAMEEIEQAIAEAGTDGDDVDKDKDNIPPPKRRRTDPPKRPRNDPPKRPRNDPPKRARNASPKRQQTASPKRVPVPPEKSTPPVKSAKRETQSTKPSRSSTHTQHVPKQELKVEEKGKSFEEKQVVPKDEKVQFDAKEKKEVKLDEKKNSKLKSDDVLNIKIVSESNLKHWIVYGDLVKERPGRYKSRPMYPREYSENQAFPVLLSNGKYAGIKLHKTWPLEFPNEYDAAIYDSKTAWRVLLAKDSLASGEINLETDAHLFLEDFTLTENEIIREIDSQKLAIKTKRIAKLNVESQLIELDSQIKNCLGLSEANPSQATDCLEAMRTMDITELMLKKHSHIVELVRRLCRYVGNYEAWNLSDERLKMFKFDAFRLRRKATEVCEKFKSLIKVPASTAVFWDGFNLVIQQFIADVKDLSTRDYYALCAEPFSREAILARLEYQEETKNSVSSEEMEIVDLISEAGDDADEADVPNSE